MYKLMLTIVVCFLIGIPLYMLGVPDSVVIGVVVGTGVAINKVMQEDGK